MKSIVFTLFILACLIPLRADILANSNFADGRAHWKGDAQPADTTDLSDPSTSGGVVITLKKDKWTKMYQIFRTKEPKLRYTITFKLSSDYNLVDLDPTGIISGPTPGLDDIEGMDPLVLAPREQRWTLVACEIQHGSTTIYFQPDAQKNNVQTQTGVISGFFSKGDNEKVILLAFPPGEGSVTVSSFSLTPESSDSADTN